MRYRSLIPGLITVLSSCVSVVPPAAPQPRALTPVAASFGKTWDGVIDVFAARNIPIKNMDRASGFIATDALRATKDDEVYADCGTVVGMKIPPALATYNVVVRGDSSASTVRVTVAWAEQDHTNCTSRGGWEAEFENQVKATAEGHPRP